MRSTPFADNFAICEDCTTHCGEMSTMNLRFEKIPENNVRFQEWVVRGCTTMVLSEGFIWRNQSRSTKW
jgi:hypothetical protein